MNEFIITFNITFNRRKGDKMRSELLTKPIKIGSMEIKNRMAFPPMNTNFSDMEGAVTAQMADYFVRRAQGGAGLITLEAASITPEVKNHGVQPMLYDEKYIPAWHNLVERLQLYGTKVSVEIVHYGSECAIGPRVSASDVSGKGDNVHPLTKEEILEIEDEFVHSALLAQKAGFDAITLHACHGYLIAEFLSPLYNKRTDEYGGSLENRSRFLMEIVDKCRKALGPKYPIIVRISGDENFAGGRKLDETVEIAKMLEKAGVAAIDISGAIDKAYIFSISPYCLPGVLGYMVKYAKAVKRAVSIPVIVAGGIRTPQQAEKIIADGSADIVSLGRTLLADPDFPQKVTEGRYEDIRKCLTCQTCWLLLEKGRSLRCAVNAEVGHEYEYKCLRKTEEPKKIAVVGAGPAGMEFARVAAIRGNDVTIIEKNAFLGGNLNPASVPPQKEMIYEFIKWYEVQLRKLNVNIMFNTEWSEELKYRLNPDEIIIAAGSDTARFIKGSENAIPANKALLDQSLIGDKIVIIGGGATGSETAETIANERVEITIDEMKNFKGDLAYTVVKTDPTNTKDITIVEMLPDICMDMDSQNSTIMKLKLEVNGVKSICNAKVKEIRDSFVEIEDINSGETKVLEADTVILAGGLVPVRPVEYGIMIGDSRKPGKIVDAVAQGYAIGRMI
jgi:2,4-dienoyl-CoA reductase-like NADH-dependent reductase (Old Yellow Enzyme family)